MVERGEFTAKFELEQVRYFSHANLGAILGREKTAALSQLIAPTIRRRLYVERALQIPDISSELSR